MTTPVTRFQHQGRTHTHTWTGITEGDPTGEAAVLPGAADRSVHVFGTFGGGTITMQGSNQKVPTDWQTLHDSGGDPLTFTTAGILAVDENVLHYRPLLSGGSGSSVNVIIASRSTQ